jgi:cob(I)alamin adenosyltransferase
MIVGLAPLRGGMIRGMKIYTKTGDDGSTGLFGGTRVSKADRRIEAYGNLDELNAAMGLVAAAMPEAGGMRSHLQQIQNELFVMGAILASPDSADASSLPSLDPESVARLEREIDAADAQLPALKSFILPGGTEGAARLHAARTICRRAERSIVALARDESVPQVILVYVNRLSDWLFVYARLANHLLHVTDVPWKG